MAPEGKDGQAPDRLLALLPGLLKELAAGGVVELEVEAGDARLYLRQHPDAVAALPLTPAAAHEDEEGKEDDTAGLVAIAAPLSGVFYPSPSPAEPPYVQVGDEVAPGQVVGLIEAMKVFNELHAEIAGIVARILVSAGQQVQSGATLLLLQPLPGAVPEDGGAR
jgi:acetyl-CoA carboxylase biotin carboxyl carrier protein